MLIEGRYNQITTFYKYMFSFTLQKRLRYWLKFLKSGQRNTTDNKLKIIIAATHLDAFTDTSEGKRKYLIWKHLVSSSNKHNERVSCKYKRCWWAKSQVTSTIKAIVYYYLEFKLCS